MSVKLDELRFTFGKSGDSLKKLEDLLAALKKLPPKIARDVINNLNAAEHAHNQKISDREINSKYENERIAKESKALDEGYTKLRKDEAELKKREDALRNRERFSAIGEAMATISREMSALGSKAVSCIEHGRENCDDRDCIHEMKRVRAIRAGTPPFPFGYMPFGPW
jgi:hypothetical protein